jgi:amino acid adenylation domain-containing protein
VIDPTPKQQSAHNATRCVHDLIVDACEAYPNRIALRYGEERLRYAELLTLARAVAGQLLAAGIRAEDRVALLARDSVREVIGMLGCLMAGGAVVPLDSSQPEARLRLMLETAAPFAILTDSDQHLEREASLRVDLRRDASGEAPFRLPNVLASQLFGITFTSGSSGRPKGVAVEHRQLVNYVHGMQAIGLYDGVESLASLSKLCTDLGHTAVFGALCTGTTLHLIAEEVAVDPIALGGYFEFHGLDLLKVVPDHFEALCAGDPLAVRPRKRLVLGGNAPSPEFVSRLLAADVPYEIVNHYGPTECAVGVMTHTITAKTDQPIPLDCTIPNSHVTVVDSKLQPATNGELLIGGSSVSRGYYNQPALTAERFIPDPFSTTAGGRTYRSGDQATRRVDKIILNGRLDRQVKIRGHRVELDEVSAVIRQAEGVREVFVDTVTDDAGTPRIVAFVSPISLNQTNLDSHCNATLPDPMQPAEWRLLPTLPRHVSGKVDVSALRGSGHPLSTTNPPEPAKNRQQQLVWNIWREILGLETCGLDDNFFDVGGDSIKMIKVYARLRSALPTEFEFIELFRYPTIRTLAERLGTNQASSAAGQEAQARASMRQQLRERRGARLKE